MNIKVLIILFTCCLTQLNGQELYGKYLGTERGLLSKECYDINFNKEGYLIVGTQYGPMKYDGEKFIAICSNLPIERRIMYDFEKDPKGEIYMLNSKNEIFILRKNRAIQLVSKNLKTLPTFLHFKKIHWSGKGIIIFSNNGHYKYQFKNKTLSPCSQPNKKYRNQNIFIYNPAKEFPFEKYPSGLLTFPKYTILFRSPQKKIQVNEPISSESREDFIHTGTTHFVLLNSKLYHISSKNVEELPYRDILFMEFFHDRLWLATVNGLIELDKKGKLIQTHFRGLVVGGITPLPQDGIAVSLNQYGVFICSNIHERSYDYIRPVQIATHKETTIVGNKIGQLFRFQNDKLTKIHDAIDLGKIANPNLKNIRRIEFIKNNWYICSIKGIYSVSADLKKRKKLMINDYYSFNDFFVSKDVIYAISWSGITTFKDLEIRVGVPLIRSRYQINDSVILLGSEEGLFKFHVPTQKLTRCSFFQEPYYISHIQSLSPNEFLISTRYKGIFHFKNGHLTDKYESPCISLKKAIISGNQLIAAGNQGIFVKQLNRNRKNPWTKIFDREIQNMFIVKSKLFICSDDDLITKKIQHRYTIQKSNIILNEILVGGRKKNQIPSDLNYNVPISLDFDILCFNAKKLKLYYRLGGESTISQFTEGTRLSFESLPSGNYQLKIFPVIDGKIQFSNSKKYRFKINEPFWESTLFYLLISIVVLLILLSIRLIRNLQRKKRIAERAELESKLNEYKLLAVKAQVNPHFLSNGLAAIQALILKGDNDYAAHYLAKFSFLMRKILYYSDTQFISVLQELQLVDAYLELELLRSRNHFKIDRQIGLSDAELTTFKIPSLLLQPILENAIWHGLKFQENSPELGISLQLDQNKVLVIEISDNGPGFNSINKTEEHLSKGNKLITERIETLNKQFQKQVARIDVLTDDSGTKVIFSFTSELYQAE